MGVIAETADRVAVMYAGRVVEIGSVRNVVRRGQHPYTRGLMGSIPKVGDDVEHLSQIDGSMPGLTEVPSGCAFHPRCEVAMADCQQDTPVLQPCEHTEVACWQVVNARTEPKGEV